MTISLSDRAPTEYRAHTALILHSAETEDQFGNKSYRTIVTRHDVRQEKKGQPYLGPGDFVTGSFADHVLELIDRSPMTYVPDHVCGMSRNAVAWWEPARSRVMFFQAKSDDAVQAFDGKGVPQPPLLFIARARTLYVYALVKNERPNLSTPLMLAPYWNIFSSNAVCQGSMVVPESVAASDTSSWTDTFFKSNFTGLNTTARWNFRGTYAEMLAAATKRGEFDTNWLKPAGTTMEHALCGR